MALADVRAPADIPDSLTASWSPESLESTRIQKLIAEQTPSAEVLAGRKFGVIVADGMDRASDIGRFAEYTVFDSVFGNDLGVMREAYGPVDGHSTLVAVVDFEAQEPMGALRIVKPSDRPAITIAEITDPESPWFSEGLGIEERLQEIAASSAATTGDVKNDLLDIATMAVMPRYRTAHSRDGASAALYSTCVRWSQSHGYGHWATIVDKRIFTMMQAWGEPFKVFEHADWAPYMGSKASIPVHLNLPEALERVRAFDQGVYDLYTQSKGLENDFLLPDTL